MKLVKKFKQRVHNIIKFLRYRNTVICSPEVKPAKFNNLDPQKTITCNIDLLSIHIPKTAGTSFYSTLQQAYGKSAVMRMDYRPPFNRFIVQGRPYTLNALPGKIRILHGHMNCKIISRYLDLNEDVKIITWVRNPVERVISDYYYMLERLQESFVVDFLHPSILSRMTKSLLEFAKTKQEQNKLYKYLGDLDLESLYFIGIVERFDEEMIELGKRLHWKTVNPAKQNITLKKPTTISDDTYAAIKALNRKDWKIYEMALEINEKRRVVHD